MKISEKEFLKSPKEIMNRAGQGETILIEREGHRNLVFIFEDTRSSLPENLHDRNAKENQAPVLRPLG